MKAIVSNPKQLCTKVTLAHLKLAKMEGPCNCEKVHCMTDNMDYLPVSKYLLVERDHYTFMY